MRSHTRRPLRSRPAVTVAVAVISMLVLSPGPAAGQLAPGVHAVHASDVLTGADGVGLRLALTLPGGFALAATGDWFFPPCDGGCRYGAAALDLHVPLMPLPLVTPYAVGGFSWRRVDPGDGLPSIDERGPGAGLGLRVGSASLALYLEARYEFLAHEGQWVGRVGLSF